MMRSRLAVPAVFLIMASLIAVSSEHAVEAALAHPGFRTVLVATYFAIRTAVGLAFAAFTFGRGAPQRRTRSVVAYVACAVALVSLMLVDNPNDSTPSLFVLAGDSIAVVSGVWLLASALTLGRCFGVLPEARGLVTRGPYRIVRHPLYLGEIGAFAGLSIAAPTGVNLTLVIAFLTAQAVRMRLEERALQAAFPQYAQYAASTPRLLPPFAARRPAVAPVPDPLTQTN